MSYPEPKYLGEGGLVNSWFRKADATPEQMGEEEAAAFFLEHDTFWV
jgi:hypothetical protein